MIYMSSVSANDGSMNLTVTFEPGTNLDIANVLTQNRVAVAEARLPEADHLRVRRLGDQAGRLVNGFVGCLVGVDAYGAPDIGCRFGHRPHPFKPVKAGGDGEHGLHPGLGGPGQNGGQVGAEFGKIEVAVAIDEHGGAKKSFGGF
jgi:hypothetical protein